MSHEPDRPGPDGLNPSLRREVDKDFSEDQHGSEPMRTISQKSTGPAVWPVIWAVATIALVAITLWLVFG